MSGTASAMPPYLDWYRLEGESLRISARSGVAVYPHDGGDAETLLMNAEAGAATDQELARKIDILCARDE